METGGKTSQVFGIEGEALFACLRNNLFPFSLHIDGFRFRLRFDHRGLIKTSTVASFFGFATQKFVIRRFLLFHLSPDISTFSSASCTMLSYLDSRWLLIMEGAGMHKMGWKWMRFDFFRFDLALFRWICWFDWLFRFCGPPKDIWGMHA
jgi:hypothetical protein